MWKKITPTFLLSISVTSSHKLDLFSFFCNTLASTGRLDFTAGLRMKRVVVKRTARAARDNCQWRADAALQLSISSFLPHHHSWFASANKKKTMLGAPADTLNPDAWLWSAETLLLSSPGKEGDTSAPCLFTFPTSQKRSECEEYSTLPEWNSMKAPRWKQYHPYFKQLAPNRGNLTLGCQLFYFSGFQQQTPVAQVYSSNRTTVSCRLQSQQPTSSYCILGFL